MSLVAYDASSDEESDYEDEEAPKAIIIAKPASKAPSLNPPEVVTIATNGHISDEDDEFIPEASETEKDSVNSFSKLLPKPKNDTNLADILENFAKPTFTALPTPRSNTTNEQEIIEEDDEFLHKKPSEDIIEKPNKNIEMKQKMPVKISVPSLKNFHDVDKELADKAKNRNNVNKSRSSGKSGLLSILPKAKSEQNFSKPVSTTGDQQKSTITTNTTVKPVAPAFVPDTVKHRRPATNTEDVERLKPTKKKINNLSSKKQPIKKGEESEESAEEDNVDVDAGDFFSFNTDQSLPEVSVNEIHALVAKKAAKMVETTTNYLKASEAQNTNNTEQMQVDEQELEISRKRYNQEQELNPEALQALVGGSSKRRRQQQSDIQVIDINSSQVLPNKEEWMRTALASSTTYQPTGVLVDDEPASGTRRKHQITYLAHKAKANEAELQAMWSANRQNRRATQSKYGF
ncbi:uncharacterized protein ACRADG_013266 [Cochliomyia hominivorax]